MYGMEHGMEICTNNAAPACRLTNAAPARVLLLILF